MNVEAFQISPICAAAYEAFFIAAIAKRLGSGIRSAPPAQTCDAELAASNSSLPTDVESVDQGEDTSTANEMENRNAKSVAPR
jgi:hypothetical protein